MSVLLAPAARAGQGASDLRGVGATHASPLQGRGRPVVLQASSTPCAAVAQEVPRFEPAPCPFEAAPDDAIECGYLVVPENRSRPASRTIRLAVAILRSRSATPAPDPVVFLTGGPGQSGLEEVATASGSAIRDERDYILIDQRGTGYSEPSLRCPELQEMAEAVAGRRLDIEERTDLTLQYVARCRDRLLGEGVDLAAYNSRENAADLADLRRALGHREWNLFGVSYGTRLALTVLRDHPEGIRSVILDSTLPPQVDLFASHAATMARAFDLLFANCAADPACGAAFPDLAWAADEVVDRFNAEPAPVTAAASADGTAVQRWLNGDDLTLSLFNALYDPGLIPYLPLAIEQIRAGNHGVIERMGAVVGEGSYSEGMRYSVQCNEEMAFADPAEIRASWEANPRRRGALERMTAGIPAICELWGAGEASAVENEPVTSDVPALILAGEYDPITPPAWGRLAAETLGNSFFFELPGYSHNVAGASPCARAIRASFLADPQAAPDAGCLAETQRPAFVTDVFVQRGVYPLASSLLGGADPLIWVWLGVCSGVLLSAIVAYPVAHLVARRRKPPTTMPRPARLVRWTAVAVAAVDLLLLVGLAVAVIRTADTKPMVLLFGLPSAAAPLFVLPWLSLLLTIGLVSLTVVVWLRRCGSLAGRLYAALVALAAAGVLVFLYTSGLAGA